MKTYILILAVALGAVAQQHQHGGTTGQKPEMDARLDEKLVAMNAATGDAKLDAMAAVINELVSQRRQMSPMPQVPADKGMPGCSMMQGMKH